MPAAVEKLLHQVKSSGKAKAISIIAVPARMAHQVGGKAQSMQPITKAMARIAKVEVSKVTGYPSES